jgi:hypothetical protein
MSTPYPPHEDRLQRFVDSALVKVVHYAITVILVPIMFNVQATLVQIQVAQAITTNDIATIKMMKNQRDAEMAELHRSMGEMQARLAAAEAMIGATRTVH